MDHRKRIFVVYVQQLPIEMYGHFGARREIEAYSHAEAAQEFLNTQRTKELTILVCGDGSAHVFKAAKKFVVEEVTNKF